MQECTHVADSLRLLLLLLLVPLHTNSQSWSWCCWSPYTCIVSAHHQVLIIVLFGCPHHWHGCQKQPTNPRTLWRYWQPMRKTTTRKNILLLVLLRTAISQLLLYLLTVFLAMKLHDAMVCQLAGWHANKIGKLKNLIQWFVAFCAIALALPSCILAPCPSFLSLRLSYSFWPYYEFSSLSSNGWMVVQA